MKVIKNNSVPIKLVVICCLHGSELFGYKIWSELKGHLEEYPGLAVILANEEALKRRKRFIDQDLNRSFPGTAGGNHEQKLAAKITELIKDIPLLLDIHTTRSSIQMTPIIPVLNEDIKSILNKCESKEVWSMGLAPFSLIGQSSAGVSLEFGDEYAKTTDALNEVLQIIDKILQGSTLKPKIRQIFSLSGVIAKDVTLPVGSKNFKHIKGVGYPFLLGEKSYNHQGFVAKEFKEFLI